MIILQAYFLYMQEGEFIFVDNMSAQTYFDIALKAVRYALISVAFTYNRMAKKDLKSRATNITKGKIAESLFFHYCKENNISIDPSPCTTPFWLPDQKDFIFKNGEWDIKNNFIYSHDEHDKKIKLTDLPALIPNKYPGDQWSKRNETYLQNTTYSAYLFTFMQLRKNQKDFFEIPLNSEQMAFIGTIAEKYSHYPHSEMPFLESWFYEKMAAIGPFVNIEMVYYPPLIITGCANARYWHLFQNTGPTLHTNHYADYTSPYWYTNKHPKITKFLNGTIVTTIRNKTCPVGLLPSFKSVAFR